MISLLVGAILLSVLLGVLWFFLFPVRFIGSALHSSKTFEPPDVYLYSYVMHIHSQFSYDSLGKPEDILKARDKEGIDFVIITDHDNADIGRFLDGRAFAGREIKLNDENWNLVGNLLDMGEVKVIAHPFREKYRWRLDKREDYLLELVDLRDALLESKLRLFMFLILASLLYPLLGSRVIDNFKKVVNVERYVKRYLSEGWRSKPVGGLDHHVKLYVSEVKKKRLIPDYSWSFSILRNFVITPVKLETAEELLKVLRNSFNVISFSKKPVLIWREGEKVKIYSPYENTYVKIIYRDMYEEEFYGSNVETELRRNFDCIAVGFTYSFKIWRFIFGVKPLFISDRIEGLSN